MLSSINDDLYIDLRSCARQRESAGPQSMPDSVGCTRHHTRLPAAGELLDDHQAFVARSKGTGPGTYEKQLELYSSGRNGGSAFDGTWMMGAREKWRDVA